MIALFIALLAAINIEFSWDDAADAKTWQIGVATISGGPYAYTNVGAGTFVPGTPPRISYLWTNWDDTATKYWVVRALNDIGQSDPSVEDPVGKPASPKNKRAVKK